MDSLHRNFIKTIHEYISSVNSDIFENNEEKYNIFNELKSKINKLYDEMSDDSTPGHISQIANDLYTTLLNPKYHNYFKDYNFWFKMKNEQIWYEDTYWRSACII